MPNCRFCDQNNPTGVDRCQHCGAWLEQSESAASAQPAAEAALPSADIDAQIRSLVSCGQTIAAIKLYREHTGAGLAEAKSAVEALATGQLTDRGNQEADSLSPNSLEGQIVALLNERKKIEAIRLYRTQSGAGLKEAKEAVEGLEIKHGINPKGAGCAGMVLLMIMVASVFIYSLVA
jgi:ribosomal protein L7/L12